MKKILSTLVIFSSIFSLHAQFPMKKLGRLVTNKVENEIAPFLSMDGKTLVYTRKRAMDDIWKVQISTKTGKQWGKPKELKILNQLPKLRLLGSYGINKNGTEILYVTKKRGGIGNYDIWYTKLNGTTWSVPTNLAKPINSPDQEINPIFSTDGKSIFFIRRKAGSENGDLYQSFKSGNYWKTPKKIDVGGQFFCARIAADNQTMYLSKYNNNETELFISKFKNGEWSPAIKVQGYTKTNDKYFSLSSNSTNLIVSAKKEETYDLFYKKLSKEYSSTPITKLTLNVPENYRAQVTKENNTSYRLQKKSINDLYLVNDDKYSISIMTRDFYTEIIELDLTKAKNNTKTLSPSFVKNTEAYELPLFTDASQQRLNETELTNKLIALDKWNKSSGSNHEIQIFQKVITTDSIQTETHFKDISYTKVLTEGDLNSDQTLSPDASNESEKTVTIPLYSDDKTDQWLNHITTILKKNELDIQVKIITKEDNTSIKTTGAFFKPKE